jgi:predicted nuclease of restriction endonuclease-like (RecB) superfamily
MRVHWIESDLYARQGKAVTTFKNVLPSAQSDLANEIIRDPYSFDSLTLRHDAAERELEEGLLAHIRKFLIELGAGFAFVGQQVRLAVDGESFYIDLLFHRLKLGGYIVVDLKTTPERSRRNNITIRVLTVRGVATSFSPLQSNACAPVVRLRCKCAKC